MLTDEQKNAVLDLDTDNRPFYEIARDANLPLSVVQNFLLTPERIARDYDTPTKVFAICSHYSISQARFYQLLTSYSIPLRRDTSQSRRAPYRIDYKSPTLSEVAAQRKAALDRAVDLYLLGEKLWAIRQATQISQPTLHAELAARNIPFRRNNPSPPGHLNPEQITKAREMRKLGASWTRIAKEFNTTTYIIQTDTAERVE